MARIAGVDLPREKRVEIALQYIHGIGAKKAEEITEKVGIPAERITTISEPRAAAGHYSRSHALQHGTRIAVFDFGGGTLDIAVLEVTPTNTFQVIAARGDNGLGGKNFDALLQRWVEDRLADRDPDHDRRTDTVGSRS